MRQISVQETDLKIHGGLLIELNSLKEAKRILIARLKAINNSHWYSINNFPEIREIDIEESISSLIRVNKRIKFLSFFMGKNNIVDGVNDKKLCKCSKYDKKYLKNYNNDIICLSYTLEGNVLLTKFNKESMFIYPSLVLKEKDIDKVGILDGEVEISELFAREIIEDFVQKVMVLTGYDSLEKRYNATVIPLYI